jgi:hypothetical protein
MYLEVERIEIMSNIENAELSTQLNQNIEVVKAADVVQINKKRLEHLLYLEKEYRNIIAYGVKHAISQELKRKKP